MPALPTEAALFALHLTGRAAPPDVLARYEAACRRLFTVPPSGGDAAVLRFAVRHPWSIGPLDAACGLIGPAAALRARLLLMLALLETSPSHAEWFLPVSRSPVAALAAIAGHGAAAALKGAAGLPLLLLLRTFGGGR